MGLGDFLRLGSYTRRKDALTKTPRPNLVDAEGISSGFEWQIHYGTAHGKASERRLT